MLSLRSQRRRCRDLIDRSGLPTSLLSNGTKLHIIDLIYSLDLILDSILKKKRGYEPMQLIPWFFNQIQFGYWGQSINNHLISFIRFLPPWNSDWCQWCNLIAELSFSTCFISNGSLIQTTKLNGNRSSAADEDPPSEPQPDIVHSVVGYSVPPDMV